MAKGYDYREFTAELDGHIYRFTCHSENTRNGFKHCCGFFNKDGKYVEVSKGYLNRTWESFEYESVLRTAVQTGFDSEEEQKEILKQLNVTVYEESTKAKDNYREEVLNETIKRFEQLMEYTTMRDDFVDNKIVTEDNEEPQEQEEQEGNHQPDNEMPIPAQNDNGVEGMVPQIDINVEDDNITPDDDVIDITQLTDSQKEAEKGIEEINDKFSKVIKYLDAFESLIKSNEEKIDDLKKEIEKRNPTDIEKLEMQTANSYPFNVTPKEYWKEKEKTSNYRVNDDEKKEKFVITKKDIESPLDWKTIADSLDGNGFDIMHQTLKGTLGI